MLIGYARVSTTDQNTDLQKKHWFEQNVSLFLKIPPVGRMYSGGVEKSDSEIKARWYADGMEAGQARA